MKIALLGYGKMGHAIEEIASKKGHQIVLRITDKNLQDLSIENIKKADVAIEFTNPESAVSNILFCLENNVPVISGTTGWLSKLKNVEEKCKEVKGSFLYASNFSIGVNIFFELNKKLAMLMKPHPIYEKQNELQINSKRIDEVAGTHSVKYFSDVDEIEIIHTAHNRKGFADGAVLAAEFIADKRGIFSMKDVLNF